MTRMKIRDRENRKFLTGFWDMADFVTGNRDPIPPWWAPSQSTVKNVILPYSDFIIDILYVSVTVRWFHIRIFFHPCFQDRYIYRGDQTPWLPMPLSMKRKLKLNRNFIWLPFNDEKNLKSHKTLYYEKFVSLNKIYNMNKCIILLLCTIDNKLIIYSPVRSLKSFYFNSFIYFDPLGRTKTLFSSGQHK